MTQETAPNSNSSAEDESKALTPAEKELTPSVIDDEPVQLTPALVSIGIAALILGVIAGLIMSFTATSHG